MMLFKKTLLAIMICGATVAHADYRFELGGSLGRSSFDNKIENQYGGDNKEDIDTDSLDLGATLYFSPVSTAKGPLAEAAFLSKASEISFDISRHKEEDDYGGYKDKYDINKNFISGEFILPKPSLIFRGALGTGKNGEADTKLLALGFGGYITDHITLTLDYEKVKYDSDHFDDESVDSYTLKYKQLIEFGGDSSLVLEPYLTHIEYFDDADAVGIDVVWYINRQLGLSAGISGYASEEEDGDRSGGISYVGVDYFINESVRVGGKLTSAASKFDSDDGFDEDGDGHGVEFNVSVRF
jgi:hypothetical protein